MYDEVWNRIVKGNFQKSPGCITGFRRVGVRNEDYPGLVKGDGIVTGCIWYEVDDRNLKRLDVFEGEYYERKTIIAVNESGENLEVNVYIFRNSFRKLLTETDWDVDEFERSGLKKFIARYVGFEKTS